MEHHTLAKKLVAWVSERHGLGHDYLSEVIDLAHDVHGIGRSTMIDTLRVQGHRRLETESEAEDVEELGLEIAKDEMKISGESSDDVDYLYLLPDTADDVHRERLNRYLGRPPTDEEWERFGEGYEEGVAAAAS